MIEIISVEIIRKTTNNTVNDSQKFKFDFQKINTRHGSFSNALNGYFSQIQSNFWNQQNIRIQYNECSYNILPDSTKYENQNYYTYCSQSIKMNVISETEIDEIKLKIFEGLKERFPDCLIQIDPLKTYIIIDWN